MLFAEQLIRRDLAKKAGGFLPRDTPGGDHLVRVFATDVLFERDAFVSSGPSIAMLNLMESRSDHPTGKKGDQQQQRHYAPVIVARK